MVARPGKPGSCPPIRTRASRITLAWTEQGWPSETCRKRLRQPSTALERQKRVRKLLLAPRSGRASRVQYEGQGKSGKILLSSGLSVRGLEFRPHHRECSIVRQWRAQGLSLPRVSAIVNRWSKFTDRRVNGRRHGTAKLGTNLKVSAIGLGCMGMSYGYGPAADRQEMISPHPRGGRARRHASSTPPRSTARSRTKSSSARPSPRSASRS